MSLAINTAGWESEDLAIAVMNQERKVIVSEAIGYLLQVSPGEERIITPSP